VLYFLMIRPQMKRAKEHKVMLEALQKGDEVITAGGVLGKHHQGRRRLRDDRGRRRTTPRCSVQKAAVQTLLPKGTMKAI
jgi:preprotein translocase subunit YajC